MLAAAVADRPAVMQALSDTFLVPSLPVDPSSLTHDQAYALLLEQIRERSRRFYVTSLLVAFLACVGSAVVYALYTSVNGPKSVAPQVSSMGGGSGGGDTVLDFEADTDSAPGHTIAAAPYLHKFGITIAAMDPPTSELVIMNNRVIYNGEAIEPGRTQNILLQQKTNNVLATFVLRFNVPVVALTFTRPRMFSSSPSGITFPSWRAQALDQDGNELSTQAESLSRDFGDIPAQSYTLRAPAFRNIATVVFQSDPRLNGVPFAGFSSLVLERLSFRKRQP